MTQPAHDVAILGTGLAGTMLGAILARQGVRVVLVDRSEHPRFAIGESTIPQTSMMLRILAKRFGVPEIARLSGIEDLDRHVASSCGVKRHFGFVYHREGREQDLAEANQTVIPEFLHGPESHLYRQDTDAWMLIQALRHGAAVRQRFAVGSIDFDAAGVTLADEQGREIRARYLVDGSGFRSPLARRFGLRAEPESLATHSRTLFTHMVGVRPYEDCVPAPGHGMPRLWSQGTLHHLFDGGWLWVIPFNNREAATNPLVSVGLTLDTRRHPGSGNGSGEGLPPAEEFAAFLARYPSIARQFEGAVPFREWVGTPRLQYASRRMAGERYCLLSHSAGFIDAFFSRGLANTTEIVQQLALDLLPALAEDDLSAARMATVERLQESLIRANDRLVSRSFAAFRDFSLWNAWHRVWVVGAFLGWLRLTRIAQLLEEEGAGAPLARQGEAEASRFGTARDMEHPGGLCPGSPAFDELFDAAAAEVDAVEEGRAEPAAAAARIMDHLRRSPAVPPLLALGEEERLHTPVLDQSALLDLFRWIKGAAPAEVRHWYGVG